MSPEPCPAGTYLPWEGAADVSRCVVCTGGRYCMGGGATPTGPCKPGFYCPVGSTRPDAVMCPAGHYCNVLSSQPTPCPSGTFGSKPGLPSLSYCQKCPNGFFCPAGCVEPMAKPTGRPTRRPTTRRPVRPTPGRGWSGERRRFSMQEQSSQILPVQSVNRQAAAGWFVFDWLAHISRNFSFLPFRINLWNKSKSWAIVKSCYFHCKVTICFEYHMT